MNSQPLDAPALPPMNIGQVVVAYALLASLWIGVSDTALEWLLADSAKRVLAGTLKDWAFIGVTAPLLYAVLRRVIGPQKQALAGEQAARLAQDSTQRLLQALADATPDAIFAKDREGRYLLCNPEALRVAGLTAIQVLGHDDSAIFSPEQAATLRRHDLSVMAQDRPETFEELLDTQNGRQVFQAIKGPLHDRQGHVIGMFGISRDITAQLEAQTQLRESEARHRLFFDANPQPMWAYDRTTLHFLAVNDAAVKHYGYARDEFLAMTIADIRPAPTLTPAAGHLTRPPAEPEDAGTWAHCRKDGRQVEAEISSTELMLDGRPARLVLAHDVTERQELERRYRSASETAMAAGALLRDVLARVDDGLVALDRNWTYTYLNDQAARMLGRKTPQDLLGRHIWTEFPEGVGQPFHRAYEQAMATQQPVVFEDHYEPWDAWFENRVYPSPDGLSIYFTDVTVRKRAEKALQLSESRYRLAASGGQVWDWNVVDGRVDFPAGFWQRLGCEAPAAPETSARFEALLHPEDAPVWRRSVRDHLARRAPYVLEFRARHATGEWRWFHTQGQAVWDASGRATYMAGTTFDITERKRAEAELRESEAFRRSVFEQLGDGVLLFDFEQRLLDANPEALRMLGYQRDDQPKLQVHAMLPTAEHKRADSEVRKVMAGQIHLGEWTFQRKDGSLLPVEASARAIDARRFVAVIRDITLRRASQEALQTHQFELSQLTQQLMSQEKSTTRRVAQTLHDRLGQTLAAARLNLDASLSTYGTSMPEPLKAQSDRVSILLDQAMCEVREVLNDLRPPLLDDDGLVQALENEIGARTVAGASPDVLLEVADDASGRRWPADVEYGAFMVAREAMANARVHAGATLVRVVLGGTESALHLDVIDDGTGIPVSLTRGRPGHLGIVGMRERASALGALFAVERMPESGTRVSLRWNKLEPRG